MLKAYKCKLVCVDFCHEDVECQKDNDGIPTVRNIERKNVLVVLLNLAFVVIAKPLHYTHNPACRPKHPKRNVKTRAYLQSMTILHRKKERLTLYCSDAFLVKNHEREKMTEA